MPLELIELELVNDNDPICLELIDDTDPANPSTWVIQSGIWVDNGYWDDLETWNE